MKMNMVKFNLNKYSIFFCLILFLILPDDVFAYVGPGAGFAFISSFFVIFFSLFLSLFSLLLFPVKVLINLFRRRNRKLKKTNTKRIVIAGFDGMDPGLTNQYIAEGELLNFARLKEMGGCSKLGTTNPPISPVAWSSFSTGTNPGKHNIFDFLEPDRNNYMSKLSSVDIHNNSKSISLGKYCIPLGKPQISGKKKSKTFWKVLGEYGVFSTVLRVPITYPPEKFFGTMISGMCVPDISGTQGTFSFYSNNRKDSDEYTGGRQIKVKSDKNKILTYITGPPNPFLKEKEEIKTGITIEIISKSQIKLKIGRNTHKLFLNKYSDWIEVSFKALPGIKISGIVMFYLKSAEPDFELYMTPVHIDPENPAQPVGFPRIYSIYLSKLLGKFGTLGLAEDTWAVNEGIIDEKAFWEQSVSLDEEHEKVFFHSLRKIKKGTLVCVFDLTDRVQHLFMRYLDPGHPANKGRDTEKFKDAIKNAYKTADKTLGKILENIDSSTALIVLSDHGFKQFKRGFNLNKWLFEKGYLVLKNDCKTSGEWFRDVDWNKTSAYGLGLSGLYINQEGREKKGTVKNGNEKIKLLNELKSRLADVLDNENGKKAIREAHITSEVYKGPYKQNAPDLLMGYYPGYRTSWNSVSGRVSGEIFEDNNEKWSGDHCIDFREVPGIIYSNRKIMSEKPEIIDIAPSVLNLLGIEPPPYMDGKPVISGDLKK